MYSRQLLVRGHVLWLLAQCEQINTQRLLRLARPWRSLNKGGNNEKDINNVSSLIISAINHLSTGFL